MQPTVIVVADQRAMDERAADIVAEVLARNPGAAISLPTGSTPVGMFHALVRRQREGTIDLSQLHLFCLDEYLGVSAEDPNTLTSWLRRHFVEPAGIAEAHLHTLPVADPDSAAAAARYEADIAAHNGLELAVLGISGNGHVAYNEPGSAADSRTRVVDLTPESIEQAAGYFGGATVPSKAMTVGVGTLLEAKQIVLIASGAGKQAILKAALQGPMTAEVPASWLRLVPERVTFLIDEAAAAGLN